MISPADSYETHKLERSGFGESPDSPSYEENSSKIQTSTYFVCKTKLESVQIHEECKKFNFDKCIAVSRKGKSGGIAMMWNYDINVNILSYSRHYIDAEVQCGNGKKWRYTGVYGHPEAQQKKHTWTLLRRLSGLSSKPWLCFGDFNEILSLDEKSEGMIKTFGWYLSSEKLFKIVSWLIWVIKGINSRGVMAGMGYTLWKRG